MERVVAVARECGYLDGLPAFLGPDPSSASAARPGLALATGSQGEPRAALARIAEDEHPTVTLRDGRSSSSSPRAPSPATRRRSARSSTASSRRASTSITDRTHLVHVSGHPRRAELASFMRWLRPKIAIPAHGEASASSEHAAFARAGRAARSCARSTATRAARRGRRGRSSAQIEHGRRYKDGDILLPAGDDCVGSAEGSSFAGVVSIALALTDKGELAGDPDVLFAGLPSRRVRARRWTKSSTTPFSRPSRVCRAPSGATPISSRRSNAPFATPSTPPGARNPRMCHRLSRRFDGL